MCLKPSDKQTCAKYLKKDWVPSCESHGAVMGKVECMVLVIIITSWYISYQQSVKERTFSSYSSL